MKSFNRQAVKTTAPAVRRAVANAVASLLDLALGLLSRRDYSEAELRCKLAVPPVARCRFRECIDAQPATAVSQDKIDQEIAYCYDRGWLDDGRFARRYVSRRSKQGYGEQRVHMELPQQGINRDYIDATFAEAEINRTAQAFAMAVKKLWQPLPVESQTKIKVQRYLLSRGFSFEEIQSILYNFINRWRARFYFAPKKIYLIPTFYDPERYCSALLLRYSVHDSIFFA